jgi:hypothetical protein
MTTFADARVSDPSMGTMHTLQTRGHPPQCYRYVVAMIQLFSFLKAPTYDVVVGEYKGSQD